MKVMNFPGRVEKRRASALERLKRRKGEPYPELEYELTALHNVINEPTRVRTKKDRTAKAKVR